MPLLARYPKAKDTKCDIAWHGNVWATTKYYYWNDSEDPHLSLQESVSLNVHTRMDIIPLPD
eukprot:scaffold1033_cov219-Chaetoceros_neogracile.AAC.2